MAQRGITQQMIADTIEYGQCVRKQQISYYVMLAKCIPEGLTPAYADRLKNCIVLVNWLDEVMTVYRNSKGLKAIGKKSEYRKKWAMHREVNSAHSSLQKQANKKRKVIPIDRLIAKPKGIRFTNCVEERLNHLNLSVEDIVLVLKHGRRRRASGGRKQFLLNGCGAMQQYPADVRRRLNGLKLILTSCGMVIKVEYGNKHRFVGLDVLTNDPHSKAA